MEILKKKKVITVFHRSCAAHFLFSPLLLSLLPMLLLFTMLSSTPGLLSFSFTVCIFQLKISACPVLATELTCTACIISWSEKMSGWARREVYQNQEDLLNRRNADTYVVLGGKGVALRIQWALENKKGFSLSSVCMLWGSFRLCAMFYIAHLI